MEDAIMLVLFVVLLAVALAAIALSVAGGAHSFFLSPGGGWQWIMTHMDTHSLLP